jgi:hypothetical protein
MGRNTSLVTSSGESWDKFWSNIDWNNVLGGHIDDYDECEDYEDFWERIKSELKVSGLVLNTEKRRRFNYYFLNCYLKGHSPKTSIEGAGNLVLKLKQKELDI